MPRARYQFATMILFISHWLIAADLKPCPRSGTNGQTAVFGDYVIKTTSTGNGHGCFDVRKNGLLVYSESDAQEYGIGNNIEEAANVPTIKIGTDITGGGLPDALVWSWSGGAHCCFKFYVLELGERFSVAAIIDAGNSDGAHFEDLKHDGHYEFIGNDWTFEYWHTSFGESPAPQVILRPEKIRVSQSSEPPTFVYNYRLALDLMREEPPTSAEFDRVAKSVSRDNTWGQTGEPPPSLWSAMLNFIFTGNTDLAWKLLDSAWPQQKLGKQGFLGAFCDEVEHSLYWNDLEPLMKNAPADCFR